MFIFTNRDCIKKTQWSWYRKHNVFFESFAVHMGKCTLTHASLLLKWVRGIVQMHFTFLIFFSVINIFDFSRGTSQGNHDETMGIDEETQVYQRKKPKLPSRGTEAFEGLWAYQCLLVMFTLVSLYSVFLLWCLGSSFANLNHSFFSFGSSTF